MSDLNDHTVITKVSVNKPFVKSQQSLLQSCLCVGCRLNSDKHSQYFVWQDTSERVARRCHDTVDRKRVNSCVLKHRFFEGVEQSKKYPKKPGNAFSDALLMSRFQISWLTPQKNKTAFETALREAWINSLIRINLGPKILTSCFIHWRTLWWEAQRCA